MKKLLSFKHWQLFLLIFICAAWTGTPYSPTIIIVNGVAVVTFTLWIYAIGIYGQQHIAALELKTMNVGLFRTNVVIVGSVLLIQLIWAAIQGDNDEVSNVYYSFGAKDIISLVVALYLVFATFQTVVFVCKTIAKLEYRREVTFNDYSNNLWLMFFFFIGIWFLQPKVNRLIAKADEVAY